MTRLPSVPLCLSPAKVYTFFYDGLGQGRLMRRNQNTFISVLKETASGWSRQSEAEM